MDEDKQTHPTVVQMKCMTKSNRQDIKPIAQSWRRTSEQRQQDYVFQAWRLGRAEIAQGKVKKKCPTLQVRA
jgi:hypothetical protein